MVEGIARSSFVTTYNQPLTEKKLQSTYQAPTKFS